MWVGSCKSLEIRSVKGVSGPKIKTVFFSPLFFFSASRTLHDIKLKATAGMSQQINSRPVAKLTGG